MVSRHMVALEEGDLGRWCNGVESGVEARLEL
jgi:hypothetical protein